MSSRFVVMDTLPCHEVKGINRGSDEHSVRKYPDSLFTLFVCAKILAELMLCEFLYPFQMGAFCVNAPWKNVIIALWLVIPFISMQGVLTK